MDRCIGLGRILGHRFRARYSTTETLPNPLPLVWDPDVPRLMESLKDRTRTYHGEVCERCGQALAPARATPAPEASDA